MTLWGIVLFALEAAIVFLVSTLLFDILHYLLHRWEKSRFRLLRLFSSWHWVHHKFLDRNMQINPRYVRENFWFHILPEYVTSMAGTVIFLIVFPWPPVAAIAVLRTIMLVGTIREEGMDFNHMSMDRLDGQRPLWWVNASYHALHHVYPHNFFSSFFNLFDLFAGTGQQIEGRHYLVTGASGAYGSAMVKRLQELGGVVETAKSGVDFAPGDYERMREKLERADVLILAHGAKSEDCWNANYRTPTDLIDLFTAIGRDRLTPPEVWGLGSEVELHGDLGMDELKDYAASKRAFAARAIGYYLSGAVIYRHIVPAAFTSAMGKGGMSAATAVGITLFFIKRGFTYVPVTYTTLALWNYLRFRFLQRPNAQTLHPAE
ncbi:MAG TPA: sterol desaturase family protein [Devosiaceae bacterium]|jgi:hypothetical protein